MSTKAARMKAAQAWCTPQTEKIVMVPEIAFAFAEILDKRVYDILDTLYKEYKEEVEEWVRDTVVPELDEYQNCAGCTHC